VAEERRCYVCGADGAISCLSPAIFEATYEPAPLAGLPVTFDGVQRQRCMWCGALIEERNFARMAVATDSSASSEVQQEEANRAGTAHWQGFVAIEGTNPVVLSAVDEPEDGQAPERSCMRLLPSAPLVEEGGE
jgi:hypothetical protein